MLVVADAVLKVINVVLIISIIVEAIKYYKKTKKK